MIPMEKQYFDDIFDMDGLVKKLEEDNTSS